MADQTGTEGATPDVKPTQDPTKPDGAKPAGADEKKLELGKLSREELEARLQAVNQDLSTARRTITNREDEAKRVHTKYEQTLKELGDEEALEEFRTYKKEKAKIEEERARREGDLEKVIAAREKKLSEAEQEIENLRLDSFKGRIHRELADAASRLDAVSLAQVTKQFGDPSEWMLNDKGDLVHKTRSDPDTGTGLSPQSLLEREKKGEYANFFRSALQAGSGSAGGSGGGGNGAARVLIRMSGGRVLPEDQLKYDQAVKRIKAGELSADSVEIRRTDAR